MSRSLAVVGVADHNGWAIFVSVGAVECRPIVIDRRRVQLLDPGLPRQPYHYEATQLDLADTEKLISRVEDSAAINVLNSVAELQQDIAAGYKLTAITIREDPVRPLPKTLAEILSHHPSIHAAEGILYRHALRCVGHTAGIEVESYPRKDSMAHFASRLEIEEERLDDLLREIGQSLGPPWQKDHKVATSAAMAILSGYTKLSFG